MSENLCSGEPLAIVLSLIYVLTIKPITFFTNIHFLAEVPLVLKGTFDPLVLNNSYDPKLSGESLASFGTFISLVYENIGLGFAVIISCCVLLWKHNLVFIIAIQRVVDLHFVVIFVPLSHTNFFVLNEARWYFLMVYRLFSYGFLFGITAIIGFGRKEDTGSIKDMKHLLKISWVLLNMCLKLVTCSSAAATYLTVGIVQDLPVRASYFAFSLHRGLTALFTFGANTLLLQYEVHHREEPNNVFDRRLQACILKWEVHSHIAAWNDFISYGGLIVLNIYILAAGETADLQSSLITTLVFSVAGHLVAAASYIFGTKWCGRDSFASKGFEKVKAIFKPQENDESIKADVI